MHLSDKLPHAVRRAIGQVTSVCSRAVRQVSALSGTHARVTEAVALAILLALTAAVTFHRIDEPAWEPGHQGYLITQHAANARNLVRYGYASSGLCLLTCYGSQPDSGSIRQVCGTRADNPPLMHLLISLAYRVLGESEGVSRLPSAASSVALVLVCYLIARCFLPLPLVLLAALFASLTPTRVTYGRLAEVVMLSVFFGVLAIYLYLRWIQSGRNRYVLLSAASFVASVFSGWNGYFAALAIAVHYVLWGRRVRCAHRLLAAIAAAPLAAFSIHLAWAYWCGGSREIELLYRKLLFRTLSGGDLRYSFTTIELLRQMADRLPGSVTPTLAFLSGLGAIAAGLRALRRHPSAFSVALLSLMVFWLACNLFLQNTVFIHDYFMYYGAVPFFALAAVEGIRTLASWLPLRRWLSLSVVSAVALYFFIPQAVTSLHTFHMREPAHVEEVVVGSALNSLTEPDQVLLFSSAPPYPRMRYYIDRQFKVVTDIEGLQRELAKTPAPPLYVLDARTQVPPELRRYLFEHFRVEQMGSYSVFDLTAQPGNTFQPAREASATPVVRFDAPLELLSAELSPTVVTSAPQASWWHRYLNAHPELLPENQTRVTVTYVWRASGRVGQDYSVVTRLIHVLTGEAAVEVRQQPFSGNLPTSLWQPGEVIRDEFELVLPARATPGRYRLEVALLDAGEKRISSSETPSSMYPTLLVMPRKPDPPVAGMAPGCESLSEPLRPSPLTVAGWCRNPGWIDIYWRIASPTSENYFGTLLFTSEDLALERNVGLLLASTWQPGALYRTRVPLASGLIPSQYQVELLVTGEVDPDHPQALPLGAYRVDGEVFPAIVRVGQPDLCSKECSRIDPNSPLNVRYSLPAQRAVDVVIAWAGRFQLPKMRVQVWLDNDVWVWKPKLLCTLVVGGDQPSQTAVRIPKRLTVPGENRVVIGVAKPGEAYLGWRWLAVTLIPNLKHFIKDSYQPYSGWADVDFVDVRLATEPTSREELLEVADLYESQGLYSVALDFLERAMALHPEQATLADRLREARLRLGTGATDEAAALYHEVLMLVGQGETLSPPECEILIEALYNLASLTHEPELRLAYQAALETVVPNYDPQLLGGAVLYLGHELSLRGRDAIVRLYFVPISTPSLDYTVWLHAKPDNVEVLPEGRKQHGFLNLDHLPLQPTSRWKPHRLYVDEHRFEVGAACYDVDFGLWHGQSGSRLLTESGNHGLFLGRLCAYEPAVASTPRAQAAAEQLTLGQVLRLLSMHAQARQHYSRVVQLLNLEESLNQDERRILIQALLDLTSMSLHPDITRAYEAVLADVVPGYEPVTLGGVVRYLGHEAVVADGEIIIRLYLVPLMHIDGDYVIWMHASPDNKEVLPEERKQYGFLNLDRRPTPATSLWRPHQLYVDERQFTLEKACYSVRFGFWRPENGSRLLLPDGQQGISLGEICVGQERISLSTAVD